MILIIRIITICLNLFLERGISMEKSFHYMLMAIQSLVHKSLLSRLKDTGLTAGQPKILEYLYYHNGASQKEIASGCHIEAGSLTSLLNRMEENHLVQRQMLNGNRRSYYIFLTDKGSCLADLVIKQFKEIEAEIWKDFSENDVQNFLESFSHIYEHLLPKEEAK